jgi:hypothetical protein
MAIILDRIGRDWSWFFENTKIDEQISGRSNMAVVQVTGITKT